MKIIETKTHGYLDYLVGLLLLVLPGIIGLDVNSPEGIVPMVLGLAAIIYSLLTAYELGISKLISMRTHLVLDFLSGALLAASPWLFGFADTVYLPHLVLGIFEIIASLITKTTVRERIQTGGNL